jgi:hypothetical protein
VSRHLTDVDRRAAKAARAANRAATRPTTRPGSETTRLSVGDKVRVERQDARSGTWGRYDGREAWVTKVNRQRFPDGTRYVEIGVAWHRGIDAGTQAWFRADELVVL